MEERIILIPYALLIDLCDEDDAQVADNAREANPAHRHRATRASGGSHLFCSLSKACILLL